MATGGFASPSPALSCALCLEIFTSPKILPCAHTYCEKCLGNLVESTQRDTFPCPSCREVIKVPSKGVSAFKANFYIKSEDLDKARKGLFCSVHPTRDLELFCVDCDICICLMCKVTDHASHKTEDIQRAFHKAKARLSDQRKCLAAAILSEQTCINEVKKEQTNLVSKKKVVELDIHNRYTIVVEAATRHRDKALTSLKTVTDDIHTSLSALMEPMQHNLSQLHRLLQHLDNCQKSESITETLKLDTDWKENNRTRTATEKLTQQGTSIPTVSRPVLQLKDSASKIDEVLEGYIGHVTQVFTDHAQTDVEVKKHIQCGKELTDCKVFSLCPLSDDSVWMSYEASAFNYRTTSAEKFGKKGKVLRTYNSFAARVVNFKADGVSDHILTSKSTEAKFSSFVKSKKFIVLNNNLKGTVNVLRVNVSSKTPSGYEEKTEHTIFCGRHRSCDIDDKEEFVAVVEEAEPPNTQRKVLLFQRLNSYPVDTYTPPAVHTHTKTPLDTADMPLANQSITTAEMALTDPTSISEGSLFDPTDVCFYKLGGQEVLLVSDAARDAIHVLHVQEDKLRFLRYLAPGCPLLLQPSALNVDSKGRLWVACRGGSILVCTPLE